MPKRIFNLTDDQDRGLRSLAAETGRPMVEFVRAAIDGYLASGLPCGVVLSGGNVASGTLMLVRVG